LALKNLSDEILNRLQQDDSESQNQASNDLRAIDILTARLVKIFETILAHPVTALASSTEALLDVMSILPSPKVDQVLRQAQITRTHRMRRMGIYDNFERALERRARLAERLLEICNRQLGNRAL
jgi:hypothetical protein